MNGPNTPLTLIELLQWKTWRTLESLTRPKTSRDFSSALEKSGIKIDNWANNILMKPDFVANDEENDTVDLVLPSVAELGFRSKAPLYDIFVRAKNYGLDFCPAWVGPWLRMQYRDQPLGEWILVAMEPIVDDLDNPRIFRIERNIRDGSLWLCASYSGSKSVFERNRRFVFVKPKRSRK